MQTYLDFEKPVAELENRLNDLRKVADAGDTDQTEVIKLEEKAAKEKAKAEAKEAKDKSPKAEKAKSPKAKSPKAAKAAEEDDEVETALGSLAHCSSFAASPAVWAFEVCAPTQCSCSRAPRARNASIKSKATGASGLVAR